MVCVTAFHAICKNVWRLSTVYTHLMFAGRRDFTQDVYSSRLNAVVMQCMLFFTVHIIRYVVEVIRLLCIFTVSNLIQRTILLGSAVFALDIQTNYT